MLVLWLVVHAWLSVRESAASNNLYVVYHKYSSTTTCTQNVHTGRSSRNHITLKHHTDNFHSPQNDIKTVSSFGC